MNVAVIPLDMPMTAHPDTNQAWVVRTDFSNDDKWEDAVREIMTPRKVLGMDVRARVTLITDKRYEKMSANEVVGAIPESYEFLYCFIFDSTSNSEDESPILVLNLETEEAFEPSQTFQFRAYPAQVFWIDSNLSISNIDFDVYTIELEPGAIFDGFGEEC